MRVLSKLMAIAIAFLLVAGGALVYLGAGQGNAGSVAADNSAPEALAEGQQDSPAADIVPNQPDPLAAPLVRWGVANLVAAALCAGMAIGMAVTSFIGGRPARTTWVWRGLAIACGAGGVALFAATQDLSLPAAATDNWTLAMCTVLMLQFTLSLLARRRRVEAARKQAYGLLLK